MADCWIATTDGVPCTVEPASSAGAALSGVVGVSAGWVDALVAVEVSAMWGCDLGVGFVFGLGFVFAVPTESFAPSVPECAPPELDTVTPGATTSVADEPDFGSPDSVVIDLSVVADPVVPVVDAGLPVVGVWAVDAVALDESVPEGEDEEAVESSGLAQARPPGAATADPIPSATARAPTRPTYLP